MKKSMLISVLLFLLSTVASVGVYAEEDCTLNPTEGVTDVRLDQNVNVRKTWSSCHSMMTRLTFEWPLEIGSPETPDAALAEGARLTSKWQEKTGESLSPFVGNVVTALENRLTVDPSYRFFESIPVSDDALEVTGWDGVWIELSSTKKAVQLTVHYWANP